MLPLYLQFALNENDKALRICAKLKRLDMYDYWFSERMRIYDQYFMPRLSDEEFINLTIY